MAKRKQKKRSQFFKATVYRRSSTPNDRGQSTLTWSALRSIYVAADPTTSAERTVNHSEIATTSWNLVIMYAPGLMARDRILWRGAWLEFTGTPIPVDHRCDRLRVRAIECEPCTPESIPNACGCDQRGGC